MQHGSIDPAVTRGLWLLLESAHADSLAVWPIPILFL
jgi:hypothetical protein